jgi:hypothetical protein
MGTELLDEAGELEAGDIRGDGGGGLGFAVEDEGDEGKRGGGRELNLVLGFEGSGFEVGTDVVVSGSVVGVAGVLRNFFSTWDQAHC